LCTSRSGTGVWRLDGRVFRAPLHRWFARMSKPSKDLSRQVFGLIKSQGLLRQDAPFHRPLRSRNIPNLIPDVLWTLRAMVRRRLVIADANFPATAPGNQCHRFGWADFNGCLHAVLAVLPLDRLCQIRADHGSRRK
jgi:hypothetical protein